MESAHKLCKQSLTCVTEFDFCLGLCVAQFCSLGQWSDSALPTFSAISLLTDKRDASRAHPHELPSSNARAVLCVCAVMRSDVHWAFQSFHLFTISLLLQGCQCSRFQSELRCKFGKPAGRVRTLLFCCSPLLKHIVLSVCHGSTVICSSLPMRGIYSLECNISATHS